jgi:hypothetical protein
MGKLKRLLGGGRRKGGGGAGGPQERFPVDPRDVQAIEQLRARGVDLSGRLPVRHTLAFPGGQGPNEAATRLPNRGFDVQAQPDGTVVATRSELVTPEEIAQVRGHLTRLAERLGGSYQGWSLAG